MSVMCLQIALGSTLLNCVNEDFQSQFTAVVTILSQQMKAVKPKGTWILPNPRLLVEASLSSPSFPASALLSFLQVPDCCPWTLFVLQQFLQAAGFLKMVVSFCLQFSLLVCLVFAEKETKGLGQIPNKIRHEKSALLPSCSGDSRIFFL